MDMSPHVKKIVEEFGCPNIASPEKAREKLTELLVRAEAQLDEMIGRGIPPLLVVHRAARDVILNKGVITAKKKNDGRMHVGVDSQRFSAMLALLATATTAMLKDMAFLYDAGINGSCDECDHRDACTRMADESEDEGPGEVGRDRS